MGLYKILKIVAAILSIAGAIFLATIISKGDEAIEAAAAAGESTAMVDYMTYAAYAIFILVLVFVIYFVLKNLFTDTESLKSTLIGVGLFAGVIIISYLISGGDEMKYFNNKIQSTSGESQIVGAGLTTFYILLVGAIGAMMYSGVKKIMNK